MKITLTTIKITRTEETSEREIKLGDQLYYYGLHEGDQGVLNPSIGTVSEDEDGLYLEWNDSEYPTRLDGSFDTNKILSKCGWKD